MERFELPRFAVSIPDCAKLVPPNPAHETNDLREGVAGALSRQGDVLGDLVELAREERAGRVAAERSTRRWQWATFLLGLLTLAVAVLAVAVGGST